MFNYSIPFKKSAADPVNYIFFFFRTDILDFSHLRRVAESQITIWSKKI